ncbi:MAG: Rpn family recombination-promoting nuclease/putative transposase [Treponema sp.]
MDISKRSPQEIEQLKEKIKQLTIQDDFVFYHVMRNKHLCEELLFRLLEKKISIIETIPQATVAVSLEAKNVRLDILARDEEGNNYNIEMQVVNSDSIPKRMRIYQASIDLDFFKKRKKYKEATDTIIIFICMFDPIGKGLPIYTFKNLCEQDPSIVLGDGTLKMIVVPKEWEKVRSVRIQSVLKYIYDKIPTDSYTKELDMCVKDIKYDTIISNDSLSYFFKIQDEREEGIKEGNFNTARRMKKANCESSFIMDMTGLTKEEIEAL